MRHLSAKVRVQRSPAKFVTGAGGIGNKNRRIARPSRTDLHGKLAASNLHDARHQFAHRPAAAGAEIERGTFCAIEQGAHRLDVGIGEIRHMDVIAYTSAVGGRIIVTENRKTFALAGCHIEEKRYRVRFWDVALTDLALVIGTGGVKIAQSNEA